MAIAPVFKTEIILPREQDSALVDALERTGRIHIENIHQGLDEELAAIEEREEPDFSDTDATVQKTRWILDVFRRFNPEEESLLHGFFGSPPYVEEQDFSAIVGAEDVVAYESELRVKLRSGMKLE